MIFYATKLTIDRFKIGTPDMTNERSKEFVDALKIKEGDDKLLQWGMKIVYFDR